MSLSFLTKVVVAAALVSTSTAAMAQQGTQACQGTNCVLPLPAPPAPPAPVYEAPPPVVESAPVVEEVARGKSFGLLPLLLLAAVAGLAAYFLFFNDDEENEEPASP